MAQWLVYPEQWHEPSGSGNLFYWNIFYKDFVGTPSAALLPGLVDFTAGLMVESDHSRGYEPNQLAVARLLDLYRDMPTEVPAASAERTWRYLFDQDWIFQPGIMDDRSSIRNYFPPDTNPLRRRVVNEMAASVTARGLHILPLLQQAGFERPDEPNTILMPEHYVEGLTAVRSVPSHTQADINRYVAASYLFMEFGFQKGRGQEHP